MQITTSIACHHQQSRKDLQGAWSSDWLRNIMTGCYPIPRTLNRRTLGTVTCARTGHDMRAHKLPMRSRAPSIGWSCMRHEPQRHKIDKGAPPSYSEPKKGIQALVEFVRKSTTKDPQELPVTTEKLDLTTRNEIPEIKAKAAEHIAIIETRRSTIGRAL